MINNSIGTIAFRNYYAEIEGKKVDVANNGLLSCAYFVSTILSLFNMIKTYHLTVESTVKDMSEFGWKKVPLEKNPTWGCHCLDKTSRYEDRPGAYWFFYSTRSQAISTNSRQGVVWEHPINADIDAVLKQFTASHLAKIILSSS